MFSKLLLKTNVQEEVRQWLSSDCPSTDIGGFVVGEKEEVAYLFMKSTGVLAGVPYAQMVFEEMGLEVKWQREEGEFIEGSSSNKVVIAEVSGKCRNILLAERTALNIMSRASGVATKTREGVKIAKENNWSGHIAGTRKTTPGFKSVEKYALLVGGGSTHRQDLSQMVMLKDNHIASAGSITSAVQLAKSAAGFSMKIEVETSTIEDAKEAAAAGADIVMLDNFAPDDLRSAAHELKKAFPNVLIEASGGICEETMHLFMSPAVDIISRGNLTQGYACLDYSLKIVAGI